LNRVQMRPTQGYISLVSMIILLVISLFSMGLLVCY
jgi:Tfp pilus assembly protein PilX